MKLDELLMPLKYGTYIKVIHKDQIIYNDKFHPWSAWLANENIMNFLDAEIDKIYIDDCAIKISSSGSISLDAQKLVIEIKELEENYEAKK